MYTLKGEENQPLPATYETLCQVLHRQPLALSSQQQSKVNTFTSVLQMRKQKLCEFKVMETTFDRPQPVWLHSPGPLRSTLPQDDPFRPLLVLILALDLFGRVRADFALSNSVCSFVYNFMIFLYIPQLQTFWLSYSLYIVFHILSGLVPFTKVQTVPFFSLILSLFS